MKIKSDETTKNQFQNIVIPMFLEEDKEVKMSDSTTNIEINYEISVFDVKELYDLAYSKPTDSDAFKAIMSEAVKMDMAYRRQLTENKAYKSPFDTYNKKQAPLTENKAVDAA